MGRKKKKGKKEEGAGEDTNGAGTAEGALAEKAGASAQAGGSEHVDKSLERARPDDDAQRVEKPADEGAAQDEQGTDGKGAGAQPESGAQGAAGEAAIEELPADELVAEGDGATGEAAVDANDAGVGAEAGEAEEDTTNDSDGDGTTSVGFRAGDAVSGAEAVEAAEEVAEGAARARDAKATITEVDPDNALLGMSLTATDLLGGRSSWQIVSDGIVEQLRALGAEATVTDIETKFIEGAADRARTSDRLQELKTRKEGVLRDAAEAEGGFREQLATLEAGGDTDESADIKTRIERERKRLGRGTDTKDIAERGVAAAERRIAEEEDVGELTDRRDALVGEQEGDRATIATLREGIEAAEAEIARAGEDAAEDRRRSKILGKRIDVLRSLEFDDGLDLGTLQDAEKKEGTVKDAALVMIGTETNVGGVDLKVENASGSDVDVVVSVERTGDGKPKVRLTTMDGDESIVEEVGENREHNIGSFKVTTDEIVPNGDEVVMVVTKNQDGTREAIERLETDKRELDEKVQRTEERMGDLGRKRDGDRTEIVRLSKGKADDIAALTESIEAANRIHEQNKADLAKNKGLQEIAEGVIDSADDEIRKLDKALEDLPETIEGRITACQKDARERVEAIDGKMREEVERLQTGFRESMAQYVERVLGARVEQVAAEVRDRLFRKAEEPKDG